MARGTGCFAALALAEQLPVERLVLEAPALPPRFPGHRRENAKNGNERCCKSSCRQAQRLAGFARRNLALCVSDMLVIEHDADGSAGKELRDIGKPVNCRVKRLLLPGHCEKDLYTIREFVVKEAISCFLHTGELPKKLAQNPEMCIIYG